MAGNYRISHLELNNDFSQLRVPTLDTETGSLKIMSRAVTYRDTQKFVNTVYMPHVGGTVYEAFLRIDLRTLRHIDSDPAKQEAFINKRLPPSVADQLFGKITPIIFMLIDIKAGDVITDGDIEYINHLLMWSANRLYVTPILNFESIYQLEDSRKIYVDFVKRLLEQKNRVAPNMRVVATVPAFFQRNRVKDIFPLYENENKIPEAVVVDFGKQRITSTKMIGIVESVHSYFNDEKHENYMLYGFNVKPHKKGADNPIAEDLGCYLKGISSIGGNYRLSLNTRIFFPPIIDWKQLPKLVDEASYKYVPLTDEGVRKRLTDWTLVNLDGQIGDLTPSNNWSGRISKYNLDKVGIEAKELSVMVKEGDLTSLIKRLQGKEVAEFLRHTK